MKQLPVYRYLELGYLLPDPMHRKGIMTFVALKVAQDIFQVIVAFLIEIDDSPETVG